jgi:UDP-GlcNAc:undecaprenyl-phosphate GlcNAc-1-phosphate transferase
MKKNNKGKQYWLYAKSIFFPLAALMAYYSPIKKSILTSDKYFYFIIFTFLLSFGMVPFFHKIGTMLEITDKPGGRHIHKKETPLTGGIPIFIAFIATTYLTLDIPKEFYGLFWSSLVILSIGIIDDINPLPAIIKLLGQLLAITILVKYNIVLSFFGNSFPATIISYILTFFWIAGITNSMNCIDGMDGLASGIAMVISFFYFIIARINGDIFMANVSLILAVSILGFFPYNFRGKKGALIFLGDNGSTFIGFMIAALSIYGDWGTNKSVDIVIPLLLCAVLISDMVMTSITRFYYGHVRNIFELLGYTGQDHIHHRIKKIGLSNTTTVITLSFFTLVMGLLSLSLKQSNLYQSIYTLSIGTIFIIFLCYLIIKLDNEGSN